jgi:hypothetical protein
MSDATIVCLAAAFAACVLGELVLLASHRRAARSRRSPVVLYGIERSE